MRAPAIALVALLMAGCSGSPTQPAAAGPGFETQFLNLASISDQIGNMTNVGINTQVNVPIQVAPVTQISALSFGNQSANPMLDQVTSQGLNFDVSQLLDQYQTNL